MHPITSRRGRWWLYTASWFQAAALVTVATVSFGSVSWGEGATLGSLTGLVFAALAFPVWYVCRANPVRGVGLLQALISHGVASAVFATLLSVAARGISFIIGLTVPPWSTLPYRLGQQLPLLFFLGVLLYLILVGFNYLLLAVEASKDAESHHNKLQSMATDAELRALRAQLNPHFLFNSLHSISALTTQDPQRAREMCIRLSEFFRKSLGLGERPSITLEEELDLLEHYLAVEKIRLGERLLVEEHIDEDARRVRLPPLLLQPLVENAVLHGIATLTEGGTLTVSAERLADRLRIEVDNPFDPNAPNRRGSGRGIENVRRRMETHFGTEGRMKTETDGMRYRVVLSLPLTGGTR